nr:hypothetical protein [Tanacetum cinerariifolium]
MLIEKDHDHNVQTSGSGISNLLAVVTTFTGSGNLYCQWEHLSWQWECLVHFIPNILFKSKDQLEEEENRAIQSINKTPAQKAAKRRKLNEEVEDLKQHLEIVPDEDDGVYTKATPLARKVPVVDYEIIHLNNKPQYKIIRADEKHQLYASFITLLKNFDREDLESLWSIVKERFSTLKPNNFFDDFLLTTLGAMFERPDGQAQV